MLEGYKIKKINTKKSLTSGYIALSRLCVVSSLHVCVCTAVIMKGIAANSPGRVSCIHTVEHKDNEPRLLLSPPH